MFRLLPQNPCEALKTALTVQSFHISRHRAYFSPQPSLSPFLSKKKKIGKKEERLLAGLTPSTIDIWVSCRCVNCRCPVVSCRYPVVSCFQALSFPLAQGQPRLCPTLGVLGTAGLFTKSFASSFGIDLFC